MDLVLIRHCSSLLFHHPQQKVDFKPATSASQASASAAEADSDSVTTPEEAAVVEPMAVAEGEAEVDLAKAAKVTASTANLERAMMTTTVARASECLSQRPLESQSAAAAVVAFPEVRVDQVAEVAVARAQAQAPAPAPAAVETRMMRVTKVDQVAKAAREVMEVMAVTVAKEARAVKEAMEVMVAMEAREEKAAMEATAEVKAAHTASTAQLLPRSLALQSTRLRLNERYSASDKPEDYVLLPWQLWILSISYLTLRFWILSPFPTV